MRLYKKISSSDDKNRKVLTVPRFVTLMQKCVEHHIQDSFIRKTHFSDLYLLIITLDIANIKQAIKQKSKEKNKKSNTDIRDISQHDAVKFLKGGGDSGK